MRRGRGARRATDDDGGADRRGGDGEMSYDVDLSENWCEHCQRGDKVLSWNYTSNMSPRGAKRARTSRSSTTSSEGLRAASWRCDRRHARATGTLRAVQRAERLGLDADACACAATITRGDGAPGRSADGVAMGTSSCSRSRGRRSSRGGAEWARSTLDGSSGGSITRDVRVLLPTRDDAVSRVWCAGLR